MDQIPHATAIFSMHVAYSARYMLRKRDYEQKLKDLEEGDALVASCFSNWKGVIDYPVKDFTEFNMVLDLLDDEESSIVSVQWVAVPTAASEAAQL